MVEDKWNLYFYEKAINKYEDIISEEAIKWKTADDLNYYFLSTYAKAILTTRESICLLKNGYPDGALSRARDVYEQMVIAFYIDNNYSDELIKRYFADYELQLYKNRKLFFEIMKGVITEQSEKYQELENRCQEKLNEFKQLYGKTNSTFWWVLDTKINTFNDMQKFVGANLLIVIYKRACISTHACALSDIALLGRDTKEGSLLRTDQTWDGFETPILLLMGSFDILTQIVFKHFNLSIPDGFDLKERYEELWKTVFN